MRRCSSSARRRASIRLLEQRLGFRDWVTVRRDAAFPTADGPSPDDSLRFEVDAQGVQSRHAVIQRPLHASLLGFPGGLLLFQRPTLGIQFRLPGRKLFGFRGMRTQGLVALQLPLPTLVGQRGPRGFDFRCGAAAVRPRAPRGFRQFPPFAFPRRPAALPTPDAGHPTRPAGPQAVRLPWNAKSRPLRAATPTADARRPTRFARIRLPLRSRCNSASCAAWLLGSFRLLRFPGGLLLFQRPTLGIQFGLPGRKLFGFRGMRSQGFVALRLPLRRSSANAVRADSTSARSRCNSASCAAWLSAISAFCVSQAACCSSNARRWASNSACRAASCSASVECEAKASSRCNSHCRRSSANAVRADLDFRAKPLQFGLVGRVTARQFPPSAFPRRPAALPTPDAGHPIRPVRAASVQLPWSAEFTFRCAAIPLPALVVQRGTGLSQVRLAGLQFRRTIGQSACDGFVCDFASAVCALEKQSSAAEIPLASRQLLGLGRVAGLRSGSVRPPMPDARRPAGHWSIATSGPVEFVQRTKAGLDLGQLLVDRSLLVAQVLAGQARLRGFNHFQVDGPDAQAIARLQHRLGEVSAVQPRVGRPAPDHRPAGAAENQAMDRPTLSARNRRVQLGPDPIVHLGDCRRTTWPSRVDPRTRRTRKPGADEITDDDESMRTILCSARLK